ncbi:MAG: DUF1501 domain-containing protein [Planctomycetaceae bacterium]
MLTMLGSPRRTCQGFTRRETLKAGALSAFGGALNLPALLAEEDVPRYLANGGHAKNVIVLYLLGGAATQDMVDMKPEAPVGIRTEFKPIATNVPGIDVCEHLPGFARWMHRMAIVRSCHHEGGCHNTLPSYTGFEQPLADIGSTKDSYPPSVGSVFSSITPEQNGVPNYMYLPNYLGWGLAVQKPGPYGGFLGQQHDPLFTECTPYSDDGKGDVVYHPKIVRGVPVLPNGTLTNEMTIDRLDRRRGLLEQFDHQVRETEGKDPAKQFDRFQQQAFSLLSSSQVRDAFDLDKVDPKTRERYGNTLFGNSTLIGRRLIEAGVRFVNVSWDGYVARFNLNQEVWDTHQRNFPLLKDHLLPNFNLTFSALMEDLDATGLLDETLVVIMSEMGRTPKINADGGRDHWTYCYSTMFAGAGIKGGSVYGASDDQAAFIKSMPVNSGDICATIYECLGLNPDMLVYDQNNRPSKAANGGQAVRDILA